MNPTASGTVIDLSHPICPQTPPFPGDGPVQITVLDSTESSSNNGQRHINCSRLDLSVHCGTHMDAPFHFFGDSTTIDDVALSSCLGPAAAVELPHEKLEGPIEPAHLAEFRDTIATVRRVVLNTGWYRQWTQPNYFADHPVISENTARFLVDCGVLLVGVDFPSVDRAPFDTHVCLLGNGVLIVENLTNLDAIPGTLFHLAALPLAIQGRDGSPVRAVAML